MADAIMTIKQDGTASIRHISDGSPVKRGEFPIDLNNSGSESYLFTTSQTWMLTKSGLYLLALWGAGGGGAPGGSCAQGSAAGGQPHGGGGGGSGLLVMEIAYIDEGEYSLILGKGGTGGKAAPSISGPSNFDGIAATDGEATSIPELGISAPGGSRGGGSGQNVGDLTKKGLGGGYVDGGVGAGNVVTNTSDTPKGGNAAGFGSSGGEGGKISTMQYWGWPGGGGGGVAGGKGGDGGKGISSNAYAPGNPGQNGKHGGGGGGGGGIQTTLGTLSPYDVLGGDGGDGGDGAIFIMRLS